MKILSIVHIYYPEFWPELAKCLKNIDDPMDLVVTYVDETKGIPEMVKKDFPTARFLLCENRGFDVWPFLKALYTINLAEYDILVKLHTKRDVNVSFNAILNYRRINGSRWRNYLLGFIRHKNDWKKAKARFADDTVGMVADDRVILYRGDTKSKILHQTSARALELTRLLYGKKVGTTKFVAGTMFAARPQVFQKLLERGWSAKDFDESVRDDKETTAHLLERVLGNIVFAEGMRIVPCHGSIAASRFRAKLIDQMRTIGKTVFEAHRVNGRLIVKVFHVSIYRGPKNRQVHNIYEHMKTPNIILSNNDYSNLDWQAIMKEITSVSLLLNLQPANPENRRINPELPVLFFSAELDGKQVFVKYSSVAPRAISAEWMFAGRVHKIRPDICVKPLLWHTTSNGGAFVVLERMEGQPLKELLAIENGISVKEADRMAEDLWNIIRATEEAGVVHRDIHPGNLMVTQEGRIKIFDFQFAVGRDEQEEYTYFVERYRTLLYPLGDNYIRKPGVWNDRYSIVKCLEELPDCSKKQRPSPFYQKISPPTIELLGFQNG